MILAKRLFVVFLLSGMSFTIVQAQNINKVFQDAKALFDQREYALALVKFEPLTSMEGDNKLIPFASYYYAVSAYNAGDATTARNMFLQINQRYPNWEESNEVNYWLSQLYFESDDFSMAMRYATGIKDQKFQEDIENLKYHHLSRVSGIDRLKELLQSYPEEAVLANNLVNEILRLNVEDQDIDLINELSSKYEIAVNVGFEEIKSSPKKSIYNIGVFLPFRYQEDSIGFENIQRIWPTKFYQGLKLGVEKLQSEGININMITYDTRSNAITTKEFLDQPETKELDLIIGPVTRGPVQEVSKFVKEHKINMINPLSSTSGVMDDNGYAFLYYPSNESLARVAADYAKEHFTENKNTAIFYSGIADKPRADLYKSLIEEDSFQVVLYEGVRPAESVKIQLYLTDEEEVDKDSLVVEEMIAEMDSLREAGEEDWEIYNERDFVYDTLKILPDSIGHIFIASDDPALSASAISGIASRPDSIQFIGSSRWLASEQSVSFALMENIDATFTGANQIDYLSPEVAEFRQRFLEKYNAYPKKEVRLGDPYIGYDIMVTFGRQLSQYGKYFQIGLKRKPFINGVLTEAFNYRLTNDNQYIPILKIRNSQIEKLKD